MTQAMPHPLETTAPETFSGAPITEAVHATPGSDVTIRFADGEIGARITGTGDASPLGVAKPRQAKPEPKTKSRPGGDGQGSLL